MGQELKHLGCVKSGFETVEGTVSTLLHPAYSKFKGCAYHVLVFVDNKVDEVENKFDKHAPTVVKKVVSQAWSVTRGTTKLKLNCCSKAWSMTWKVSKMELEFISEVLDKGVLVAVKHYAITPILEVQAKVVQAAKDAAAESHNKKVNMGSGDKGKEVQGKTAQAAKDVATGNTDKKPNAAPAPSSDKANDTVGSAATDLPDKVKDTVSSVAETGSAVVDNPPKPADNKAVSGAENTGSKAEDKHNKPFDIFNPIGEIVSGAAHAGSEVAGNLPGGNLLNPLGIGK